MERSIDLGCRWNFIITKSMLRFLSETVHRPPATVNRRNHQRHRQVALICAVSQLDLLECGTGAAVVRSRPNGSPDTDSVWRAQTHRPFRRIQVDASAASSVNGFPSTVSFSVTL